MFIFTLILVSQNFNSLTLWICLIIQMGLFLQQRI